MTSVVADESEKLLETLIVALKGGDRELHRAWRRFQASFIIANSTTTPKLFLLNPSSSQPVDALISTIVDTKTGPLRRFLCTAILRKLLICEHPICTKSIRIVGESSAVHSSLLSLLLSLGSEKSLQVNIPNISFWTTSSDPQLKFYVIPAFLSAAKRFKTTLPQGIIQPCEEAIQQILSRAAPSAEKSSWKLTGSSSQQVLEPDGSQARDFFTVLNTTSSYSLEQYLNHHVFSSLRMLLEYIHGDGDSKHILDQRLTETVIAYCLRVIDQAKIKQSSDVLLLQSRGNVTNLDNIGVVAFSESVKILDFLCSNEKGLLGRLFPLMKRGAALPTSQSDGHVFLSYLQFFLNHSESLLHDVEPFFQKFFDSYFSNCYTDQIICFETIDFCIKNAEKMLKQTKVFSTYFPSILKAIAWHTFSLFLDFVELLPALISESSFIEVLNSIFDLPLLSAAMEVQQAKRVNEFLSTYLFTKFGFVEEDSGSFRVLNTHLLRSQSGVPETFWSQESNKIIVQQYFQSVPVTERILASSRLVRPLISRVFDLIIENGTEENLQSMLLVLFHRFDPRQLFPNSDYRREVQAMILSQVLTVFEKHPKFIVSLRRPIIDLLSSTTARDASGELVLALIWIVGEFLCPSQEVPRDILNDYYEALELIVFEQMAAVKVVISTNKENPNVRGSMLEQLGSEEAFGTRLALVVVGALSKFASRWPFFSSRVIICLSKLASISESMHPSVLERTNECIAVLRCPSVAAAVMGTHRHRESALTDSNSSLPFVLQSPLSNRNDNSTPVSFAFEGPLHKYSLHSIEESIQ